MPRLERTRRPGDDQLDLTSLLDVDDEESVNEPGCQDEFQHVATQVSRTLLDQSWALWEHSPYRWIRDLPAARKAKAAETLVSTWLARHQLVVTPAGGTGHSFRVGDTRVKVRLSLQWSSGEFVFQQLQHGDFDQLLLLGIRPATAHAWLIPSADLAALADPSTGWLSFPAHDPAVLASYGGTLTDLLTELRTHIRR